MDTIIFYIIRALAMANAGFRITGTTKLFHTHTGQFNCPAPLKMLKPPIPKVVFLCLKHQIKLF